MPGDTPAVNLTLRMLMSGKEVGPIIGKGGEIINSIREEAAAKIHISDGACPERVITVTGPTDAIFKAYSLICKKLEDEDNARSERRGSERDEEPNARKEGLSLRLVIPASQCGSLIGKGGSKIKEIREVTGCSVQVASDPLPGSTERMVTVTGSRDSVTQCVYHICCVFLESPAKGTTVQYQPGRGGFGPSPGMIHRETRGPPNPIASLLGLGDGSSTLAAIASIAGSQIRRHEMRNREERGLGSGIEGREATFQMTVPNELIGSVIGKGGSKIAEIRQMSGAMIRISRSDDPATAADEERQINITGNPDSVALAKSLINMSLDLHKVGLISFTGKNLYPVYTFFDQASLERGASQEDDREQEAERRRERRDDREDPSARTGHRGYREPPVMGGGSLASLLSKPDVLAAVSMITQISQGGGIGFGQVGQSFNLFHTRVSRQPCKTDGMSLFSE